MDEANFNQEFQEQEEEQSSFNLQAIYTAFILNWKWFVLSVLVCLGAALLYLRYTTPIYNTYVKLLIKEDEGTNRRSSSLKTTTLGIVNNSYGIENEVEILKSTLLAEEVVRDLKLYINYYLEKKIKDVLVYKDQPVNVDMDAVHLEKLNAPVNLKIKRKGNAYVIKGTYYVPTEDNFASGPYSIEKTINYFPASINTKAGLITFASNGKCMLRDGETQIVRIVSPHMAAYKYAAGLSVVQPSKTSSIINLQLKDENIHRSNDYLRQIIVCYNRQANEDKNVVAERTEEFINDRLGKINAELSSTDGSLESYKKRNRLVELSMNASEASSSSSEYEQKLNNANTQISLINSLIELANASINSNEVLPSNVGLADGAATSLIADYNKLAIERNHLLRSASESSPAVTSITSQLNDLRNSVKRALLQARNGLTIERDAIERQLGQYSGRATKVPEQERILTQIGRQQEVKSGLYLMLLQKREENLISLAATADKGKLIEMPMFAGKVSPNNQIILLVALCIGLAVPSLILFLINLFSYRIESHADVANITKLPIIADILTANESAKTRAGIVVHENKNDQMEEIFRSMRANVQFMLQEGKNVIMFTSSMSGEGKTFTAANLAVSFALLGKKVILVGLDIRKPRLAELFQIDNHKNGITPLLVKENPTWSDIEQQIMPSEVNDNLDLLMAGPTPPNPAELVSRQSLESVINALRTHYDYILIDTAPVGLVSDTLQIARHCDLSVFICRADFTPKADFEMINMLAKDNRLPNLCVAINGIDLSKKKHSYYYGYGKYGKYGRYGKYGKYGRYSSYGGSYISYNGYSNSHYASQDDDSVKV